MADIGNLNFGVHLVDYTDAEADKIKKKLENLSVSLTIDGKNVSVSNPDSIKKQIEDAIKSVTVQSVKVDTASLATQIQNATSNITSQVKVSFLSGTLATDIQTYLDAKSFKVSISITKSQVQNEVNTAFANVSVPVTVKVSANAVIQQLQQSIANRSISVGLQPKNVQDFVNDVESKLKNKKIKVELEADKNFLVQSVKQALQGTAIKAQVDVNVDASAITRAVQSAINNANFTYNPNGGRRNNANATANAQRNLGNSYRYAGNEASQSARASVTLGRAMATNIKIAGELGTALGNIASVFKAKDILEGVVTIGGQLENQRIALGAILQDGGKAVEMFSKIQSLAVKSPFGIMDLNQYTKQLAAYGIEYNELYDTMRRMADISAGVGVDMGRIILAFGQVRAAGFLKGTELRQFTEANIPMVEKLAERFSILEKRIVSAGEVYDMISEKKIAFEDVKAVLWDLTGEGGMFNNMQEVLSESLASKWKNLSDAIDIMYGKMSDGFIGRWLKTFAEGLTELTKNWEYVGAAIGAATTSYIAYKTAMLLGGRQLQKTRNLYNEILADKRKQADNLRLTKTFRDLTKAEKNLISTTDRLTVADIKRQIRLGNLNKDEVLHLINLKKLDQATLAYVQRLYQLDAAMVSQAQKSGFLGRAWISLGNALRGITTALWSVISSPWTWITGAITLVAELWAGAEKKQAEIKQRNDEVLQSAKGSAEALEKELQKLDGLDLSKLNADEIKSKLKDLTEVIKNEAFGWQSILSEIFAQNADGTFVNSAMEQLKLLQEKMEELAIAKKNLTENNEIYSDANEATGFAGNDIIDAVKNYNKRIEENDKKLKDLAIHAREVGRAISFATENNELLQKSMKGKSLVEQIAILREYEEEWNLFVNEIRYTNTKAFNVIENWNRSLVDKTAYGVWGAEEALLHKFRQAKGAITESFMLNGEDLSNLSESARQTILGYVNLLIKEGGVQKKRLQQFFFDWWTENTDIDYVDLGYIVPPQITGNDNKTEYDESKDEVAKMWKRRAEEIEKAVKMYDQWKKVEGVVKAQSRVKGNEELASLFSGAYGFNLDLENPTKAYEYIQGKLNEKLSAQKKLKIELGVKISDAELKDAQDKLKQFVDRTKDELKRTTDQWDLYKQLFEATGNKKFAMTAFKVTPVWDEAARTMKASLDKALKDAGFGFESTFEISDEDAKLLYLDLYNSWKEIKDRIEKNGIEVKVNTANAIKDAKDFEMQVEEIERELHKKLELIGKSGMSSDVIGRLTQTLIENAERATATLEFDKFKKEIGYTQFFANLENQGVDSILMMRDAMLKFGDSANLTHEEMSRIADDIERMMDVLVKKHPFKAIDVAVISWRQLKENYKIAKANFEKNPTLSTGSELAKSKAALEEADLMMIEAIQNIQSKFDELSNVVSGLSSMFEKFGNTGLKHFAEALESASSGMKTGTGAGKFIGGLFNRSGAGGVVGAFFGTAVGAMAGIAEAGQKAVEAEQERSQIVIDRLSKVASLLKDKIENSLTGIYNATLDATSRIELEKKQKQYGDAENYLKNLGADLTSEWIALTKDNTTFSWDTNDYFIYSKKTQEAINKALDADNAFMGAYASLLAQRDELIYQKMSYTDKDAEDVEAFKADKQIEIEQLNMEIEQLSKDMMSSLYSIDFKDWAGQLTDAIVNAWASGEDAAKAYGDTVSSILKNVASSMVQQMIIGQYMEDNLKPFVDDFIANNGLMNESLYERLVDIVDGVEQKTEDANKLLDSMEEIANKKGYSLKDSTKTEGLSKGIQSVTEDTANLLGSYLNAIRQDVSVKRTLLEQLVGSDVPKMNYLAEAQLQQLQMVVSNTKRNADTADKIYSLIDRVVDKGGNRLKI